VPGVELLVVSDTHLRNGLERLPAAVHRALAEADAVLHAGDVTSAQALAEFRAAAPLHAVLGNNDHELVGTLPDSLLLELDGVRVAMVHDSGPREGRPRRLRKRFPEADLVVFGHSHVPVDEPGIDGQWLFNPGSPTQRRSQPAPTFGQLRLAKGRILAHRIQTVEVPSKV
jgi:hypothetical protein